MDYKQTTCVIEHPLIENNLVKHGKNIEASEPGA